jgi:hypothetical protein
VDVNGAWGWAVKTLAYEDLKALPLERRPAGVVFDSDWATNPRVERAEQQLMVVLNALGAKPARFHLPMAADGAKRGLDDWLVSLNGTSPEQALLGLMVKDDLSKLLDPAAVELEAQKEALRIAVRERAADINRARKESEKFTWPDSAQNAAEEFQAELEDVGWAVDGWWPAGGNVNLAAKWKAGKTTLALNTARSFTDGVPFLSHWPTRKLEGNVGYFNYEMNRVQFREWLLKLNFEHPEKLWPLTLRGHRIPMNVDAVAERIIRELKEHEVELWIIDTKQKAQLGAVQSENDNDQITAWLDLLDYIKREADVRELLITSHFGYSREETRGASAYHAWADGSWKLTNDDGSRQLEADGRDIDQTPYSLRFDPLTKRVSLPASIRIGDTATKLRMWALMVTRAVMQEPGITGKPLHGALRIPNEDKGRAIEAAENEGWITRPKDGKATRHFPTDSGRAAVREARL